MRGTRTVAAVAFAVAALTLAGAGCSSDDETSTESTTTTRAAGGAATDSTINPEYETWCNSVKDLIEQSSPNDLSELGNLAAFTQAVQSLATTAPAPIESQMQTLATASQAKLTAVQQDPTAELPAELAGPTQQATEDVSVFIAENCGGLVLPTIDL